MTDLKIRWDTGLMTGDFLFSDNDLETDEGLATAILISLFTDRRASTDDPVPNADKDQEYFDRRGWWGDVVNPDVAEDEIGSKLWLLERGKTDGETLEKAITYAEEALQWMLDDEVAAEITVTSERQIIGQNETLSLLVQVLKTDGGLTNFTFNDLWAVSIVPEIEPIPVPSFSNKYLLTDTDEFFLVTDAGDRILAFTEDI